MFFIKHLSDPVKSNIFSLFFGLTVGTLILYFTHTVNFQKEMYLFKGSTSEKFKRMDYDNCRRNGRISDLRGQYVTACPIPDFQEDEAAYSKRVEAAMKFNEGDKK